MGWRRSAVTVIASSAEPPDVAFDRASRSPGGILRSIGRSDKTIHSTGGVAVLEPQTGLGLRATDAVDDLLHPPCRRLAPRQVGIVPSLGGGLPSPTVHSSRGCCRRVSGLGFRGALLRRAGDQCRFLWTRSSALPGGQSAVPDSGSNRPHSTTGRSRVGVFVGPGITIACTRQALVVTPLVPSGAPTPLAGEARVGQE